jgi:hypothetical protein
LLNPGDHREQHVAEEEAAALRDQAENFLPGLQPARGKHFFQKEECRSRSDVPGGAEIGEPALCGNVEARVGSESGGVFPKEVGRVMDREPVDMLRRERFLFGNLQEAADRITHYVFQHADVLAEIDGAGIGGGAVVGIVQPALRNAAILLGGANVHARLEFVGERTKLDPVDAQAEAAGPRGRAEHGGASAVGEHPAQEFGVEGGALGANELWSSKREALNRRLANSPAHASAFCLPAATCNAAALMAITPLAQTPCTVHTSQGGDCNSPCTMLANPGRGKSPCEVAAAMKSTSAIVRPARATAQRAAFAVISALEKRLCCWRSMA